MQISRHLVCVMLAISLLIAACSQAPETSQTNGQVPQESITVLTAGSVAQASTPAPSIITPIASQIVTVGDSKTVPVQLTGANGARPFLVSVQSGSETIATVAPDGQGQITLRGVAVGSVTVRVVADDGTGNRATTVFRVTVTAAPAILNRPPIVDPVPNQAVPVDGQITVGVRVFDPEGFRPFFTRITSGAESIALAESDGSGGITVYGISPGQTQITAVVSDGQGGEATLVFTVTVGDYTPPPTGTPNANPVLDTPLTDQTVAVGQELIVPVRGRDPEGFNVYIYSVTSSANSIATARSDGAGNIVIRGVSPGQTRIDVTISDGRAGYADTFFNLIVTESTGIPAVSSTPAPLVVNTPAPGSPNQPPVFSPVADQVVSVDTSLTVKVEMTDPEGHHPFFASIASSADSIVMAESDNEGGILLTGVTPGQALVTFVVDDGQGGQSTGTFNVVVPALPTATPNLPPILERILDQTVSVGQSVAAFLTTTDPEGYRPFISSYSAGSEAIARVEPDGEGNLLVTGVSPGQTVITVTVDDGQGGQTTGTFNVTVFAVATDVPDSNRAPEFEGVSNQQIGVDVFLPVPIAVSDPEGTSVTLNVISSDETIAPAQVTDGGITLYGAAPGTTTITVTATDEAGRTAAMVFLVTVGTVEDLPIVPEITDAAPLQTIRLAVANPPDAGAFVLIGIVKGLPDVPTIADETWTFSDLLNPVNNPPDCFALDPLICTITATNAGQAILALGEADAQYGTPPADFEGALAVVIAELASQGVIPVLTTIPGDSQVDLYNEVILRLARENGLPIWNRAYAGETAAESLQQTVDAIREAVE